MSRLNYSITQQFHVGPTYSSYRARLEEDGSHVVLKMLKDPYPSAQALNRLRYEFSLLQQLQHVNIVKALALEPVENSLTMVCQDVPGVPLPVFTGGQPVALSHFFALALPLLRAIQALHRQRIIHRNITPANIIVEPVTHHLTLCGFSLALSLARALEHPNSHDAVDASLAYLSPEQTGRLNRALDHRTDLYSAGCVLYELLTGQPPFVADDPMAVIHAHIARVPESPVVRRPDLPPVLARMVLRLLAKHPDDRYQSAAGLLADLERCHECYSRLGEVTEFAIGGTDVSDQFRIPDKLYGRENELAQLQDAFARAAAGQAGLVLVSGYAGVGKSGLVGAWQKARGQTHSLFIGGKFDQFRRDVPLSSLLAAFKDLLRQLLTGTDAQIDHWRQQVLAAVGGAGQVLIDVVPDLVLLIGPQPPVPALPPVEANHRFQQVFNRFVMVFGRADYPLCLFLDDLQWIDSATRQWLETRLTDPQPGHLLVVGAYRDNEVSADHPLMLMLDRLRQQGVPVRSIPLPPLNRDTLALLIADALVTTPDRCHDLTDIIFRKTAGNPFFARQCLLALYEEEAISFAPDQQAWQYDLARVQGAKISDNVVELMAAQIQRLPEGVQHLLKLAACFGNRFDAPTLSRVSRQPLNITRGQLATALQQGLIVSARPYAIPIQPDGPGKTDSIDDDNEFIFLHDRVQQAALLLLPDAETQVTRLQIGRLLLATTDNVGNDDQVYTIADHLNAASLLITDAPDIQQLVTINLAASLRAQQSAAYEPALRYCRQAMALLPAADWEQPSALTRDLLLQRAESEHLCGNNQSAEAFFDQAIAHAPALLEKARVYQRKIHYYINIGRFEQAYRTGRAAVRPLGVDLPARFVPPLFVKDLIIYRYRMGRRAIADLIDVKEMTDERLKMAILLMATFVRAAYQLKPQLCIAVCTRMVNICLRHGHTDGGSNGFLALGPIFLGALLNQKQTGFDMGRLSLDLVEKFKSAAYKAETYFVTGYFAVPWRRPALEMERHWQIAYEAGLETGDLFHASCAACATIQSYFMRGMPFDDILTASDRYLTFLHRIDNREPMLTMQAVRQSIRNLRGQTVSGSSYSDEAFDEPAHLDVLSRFNTRNFAHYYFIDKMQTLYLWGHYEQAYTLALQSDQYLSDSPGMLHTAEHYFYKALIIGELYPTSTGLQRLRWKRSLRKTKDRFQTYAAGSPACFSHKAQLLAAEYCRLTGDLPEAERLYYAAIGSARQHNYLNIQALVSERVARFHSQAGRRREAGYHLRDAGYAYRQLGATAYADSLLPRYPTLFDQGDDRMRPADGMAPAQTMLQATVGTGNLDLATVLKSSEAISRAIRLPDLLATLMKIIIENAGGQRMVFLLQRSGVLMVQAEYEAGTRPVQLLADIPLAEYTGLAQSVVSYVARTLEPVILEEAASRGNFTGDAYIQAHQSRSLLCAPLLHQGALTGVIYLENNLTGAAFTQDRIDLLQLLSGQMAISLENALLYKNLEEKVNERTAELNQSLHDLRTTQTQLVQKEKMASLGELTAGIAHEIQNPLNFVNNFAQVSVELIGELRDESAKTTPDTELIGDLLSDLADNLTRIDQHGSRASNIVKGMLEHSRVSTGQKVPVPLNDLAGEYLRLAYQGRLVSDTGFSCDLVTDFGVGMGGVDAVPDELGRVLLNLFNNAFYAVREKQKKAGVDYHPMVTLRTQQSGDRAQIQVIDNGTGMPDAVKQKMFQPFFTTKPAGEGTGLGLSLSYDIVTKGHGGLLTADSQEGTGTVMTVSLPLRVSVLQPDT